MAGTGALTLVISQILHWTGIPFVDTDLSQALQGLVYFLGFVWSVWGSWRRKDLSYGLWRKKAIS